MNAVILFIIGIPAIEIYLMIKVGGVIGAFYQNDEQKEYIENKKHN